MAWRSDPGFVGTKVGNPPTRIARVCAEHNIRTPRRTVAVVVEDGFGYFSEVLTCGHAGREAIDPTREDPQERIGQKRQCHDCRAEVAQAVIDSQETE